MSSLPYDFRTILLQTETIHALNHHTCTYAFNTFFLHKQKQVHLTATREAGCPGALTPAQIKDLHSNHETIANQKKYALQGDIMLPNNPSINATYTQSAENACTYKISNISSFTIRQTADTPPA